MLMKDQLRFQMDQLGMTVNELARRVDVSSQSVRHWLAGRSYPNKKKCLLIEEALSFKLDFSEGESTQSITVEQTIQRTSVDTLMTISRLSPENQLLLAKVAHAMLDAHQLPVAAAPVTKVAPAPAPAPVPLPARPPPKPANHGRTVTRTARGKVVAKTATIK